MKSPVRDNCTPGSVRGAPGNRRPYRDQNLRFPRLAPWSPRSKINLRDAGPLPGVRLTVQDLRWHDLTVVTLSLRSVRRAILEWHRRRS